MQLQKLKNGQSHLSFQEDEEVNLENISRHLKGKKVIARS